MKIQAIHKMFFLGLIISFMTIGNGCAKVLNSSSHFCKKKISDIHYFFYKTVFNAIPVMIEKDLECDDSQLSAQNASSLDSSIQLYDFLFFSHKNHLSLKIATFDFSLHFYIKRYLLNCIFLI